jgi:pimeloyl-ACP methyl ester carboxylesterase
MTTWGSLSLGLLLLALTASASTGAEPKPKRVLIVHSFGSTAPPFTTHSTAFQTTLTKELGERVDMDEVSLDMARYAQPDMEGPFVEFLLARLAKWQPDLVVPIGSPAGGFVVKYRDRLFPGAPVIYTGMDRRTLPHDAFHSNATVAASAFPDELYQAPRSWAEQAYPNLIHYNKLPKGGHFAAWEQPKLLSEELRAGFKSLRK